VPAAPGAAIRQKPSSDLWLVLALVFIDRCQLL
jgi:hypothetical protein